MRAELLATELKALAEETNSRAGFASWYMFGSAGKSILDASDVDLLAVCDTHEIADRIRSNVDVDILARPIHLSILTREEEKELQFIENQGCVQIL